MANVQSEMLTFNVGLQQLNGKMAALDVRLEGQLQNLYEHTQNQLHTQITELSARFDSQIENVYRQIGPRVVRVEQEWDRVISMQKWNAF